MILTKDYIQAKAKESSGGIYFSVDGIEEHEEQVIKICEQNNWTYYFDGNDGDYIEICLESF